jgi:phenylpropionate dioxygenase-like ring-hydroxylating dioxygenase large terminal subunit
MTFNHGSPIPLDTLVPSTGEATEAVGLPPEVYCDSAFYEFEVDAVFRTQWHCVGRTEMIPEPGDYFTTTLAGREPVIVARTRAGEIAVMSSVCRHRVMCITAPAERPRREWFDPPPEVSGNTRTFRCPYHWWTYNLEGQLVGAPSMERTVGFSRDEHGLPRLRVECWNGFVFANLSPDARPLAAGLEAVDAALAPYRLDEWVTQPPEVLTDVPFNWKIMVENFMESYHNYGLHNRLMSLEEYGLGNAGDEGEQYPYTPGDMAIFGVGHSAIDDPAVNATQRALFAPLASLNPLERRQVLFAYIAPTLLLGVFSDSAFWFTVEPTGPKAHTLSMGFFFPPGTSDDKFFPAILELYAKGIELFNNQDLPANVALQFGMGSQFAPRGRLSYLDKFLPKFNSWLLDRYREAEGVPVG